MLNLENVFRELLQESEPVGSLMLATPIPTLENHRVARASGNTPSILIAARQSSTRTRPAPLKLEHLTVKYDVECRFTDRNGEVDEGVFTQITCSDADPILNAYFLRVMETTVQILGSTPSRSDVERAIRNLVELFRLMTRAPLKSVQGLWSELFVINRSPEAISLVEAWHNTPEDRYDFNRGNQRVEVKSAAGRIRRHSFSLEQLQPPTDTVVLIGSLFVERAGAGTSLGELIEAVRQRVAAKPDLVMQVDVVVALALGNSLQSAMEERFDYELARQSLAFYNSTAVPSILSDLPPEITGVHFTSDLSGVPTVNIEGMRREGRLFAALL